MSTATLRAGQMVRLKANDAGFEPTQCAIVLEVFDDPKAPIAYVEYDGEPPRWIFMSDLQVVHIPDHRMSGSELRPPA